MTGSAGYGKPAFEESQGMPIPVGPPMTAPRAVAHGENEPNHILFIQNLPENVDSQKLHFIFGRHPGFLEIRQVKIRGVAFIEFENE